MSQVAGTYLKVHCPFTVCFGYWQSIFYQLNGFSWRDWKSIFSNYHETFFIDHILLKWIKMYFSIRFRWISRWIWVRVEFHNWFYRIPGTFRFCHDCVKKFPKRNYYFIPWNRFRYRYDFWYMNYYQRKLFLPPRLWFIQSTDGAPGVHGLLSFFELCDMELALRLWSR